MSGERPLKEKELRFALVCYGGVSLAVYMHGITKEILKLVRASRDFHTYTNRAAPGVVPADVYADVAQPRRDPADTEGVYFDLLRRIGAKLDLRIVVDIIAGASAGGINGVILARALAHDLDIDPLRAFWLTHSDVADLMPAHVKAGPWRKWYFRPFVWMFLWKFRDDLGENRELKQKLSMFLRSRWFKPPFDGDHLTRVLFDGFAAMGDPAEKGSSLVPAGLQLDLFVTVTDFRGYVTDTPIHNPPVIRDREHRQVLRYSYRHWPRGRETTAFDRDSLPALVFGARATSSFPGAFPPMQLREIDRLVAERNLAWNGRVDFLYRNFRPYFMARLNPADAAFIDGSVLNNKPFAQAIESIRGRPAYRHVDRRLLYVDPHPETTKDRSAMGVPGFFTTLKGALSDIPRNEPIHDDLAWVNTYNAEVRRLQMVVEGARSHISAIAEAIAGDALSAAVSGARIGAFREQANSRARAETGFAYEGYLRLKLTAVMEDVAAVVAAICGFGRDTTEAARIATVIERWAALTGVFPSPQALSAPAAADDPPPWVKFLLRFDVRYRQRRIRFVVRAVNQLYSRLSDPALRGLSTGRLDYVKAGLYDALALLQPMTARAAPADGTTGLSHATAEAVKGVVRDIVKAMDADPLLAVNSTAVAQQFEARIGATFALLADELALEEDNARTDALLATLVHGAGDVPPLPAAAARELLEHYIGFAVWDVLTFSITNWRDLDEFDEIRVDRLSPDDAQTLRRGDASATLKGIQFHHFGAFFCLAYRQNDYLWGRLHAAERLIDIVLDAAKLEGAGEEIDALALKTAAFEAILRAEATQLSECGDLISALSADVAKLRAGPAS